MRLLKCLLPFLAIHGDPLPAAAEIRFSNQAAAAGVADEGEANGAAFGDFNGDGRPDLFVARLDRSPHSLLYENLGGGRFADRSEVVSGLPSAMGGVFFDYEGDGDADLFIVHFRQPDRLLRNDGGVLAPVAQPDSVRDLTATTGAAFADFDGDGKVDHFATHRFNVPNQYYTHFYAESYADESALHSALRSGQESFGAVPFDYDNDGDLDLHVSNFGFVDLLFRNEGRGAFRQVAGAAGLGDEGMSVAGLPADYDNDGDWDLYVLRARGQSNRLFRNDGGIFAEVSEGAGVAGRLSSTGGAWADFDSDGDADLVVANIGLPDVYENRGDGTFADMSRAAVPQAALPAEPRSAGVAVADYDGDGDVDAFLSGIGQADALLRNDGVGGRGLQVELRAQAGSTALGARVRVRTRRGEQSRQLVAATQLGSVHGDLLHFGLGSEERAEEVVVEWSSGRRQILGGAVAGQVLEVEEIRPERDLGIVAVHGPGRVRMGERLEPEIEVRNGGRQRVAGMRVRGRAVLAQGGGLEYDQAIGVPALGPGEGARVRLPAWAPRRSGTHRVAYILEGGDDAPGNDVWERDFSFHPFVDVAPALGVADEGPGWAGAFADYDNDGDLDLYVSNGGSLGRGRNALYRNDGERFANATEASGVLDEGNGTGVAFADFDRDGLQDLFISKGGFLLPGESNRLFHNNGDGTFADVTQAAGLDAVWASYAASVGDYDRDGYMDLYVSQFRGQPNTLYHNDGNGRFTDVTLSKQIFSFQRFSGGAASFADYDGDGDTDLYASMFGTFDFFYADEGDSTFAVAQVGDEGDKVGMAVGDYDGDGDLDLYLVNQSGRSVLYRNEVAQRTFVDMGAQSGTENLGPGTGCAFGDYDSDGDLDLFVVNGHRADRVYMNQGDGTFADVAPAYGMADTVRARAVILGDYDGDGDLDAYVINEGKANRLYRNGDDEHRWLQVSVRGVQSNTDGIGTRLQLFAGGQGQIREVNGTAGLSYNSRVEHFGLAGRERVDSLLVRWPSGRAERFVDLPGNSRLELVEGESATAVEDQGSAPGRFALEANAPNPFNTATRIGFEVPVQGAVELAVYNALGQKVRALVSGERGAGRYQVVWDGTDGSGQEVASGVYFYRLRAGEGELRRSMVLLR